MVVILGSEEEPRVFEQALAHTLRAAQPGFGELLDLAAVELAASRGLGQFEAGISVLPGQGQQGVHRGTRGHLAFADEVLDLRRQIPGHSQVTRYPAGIAAEATGQLLRAQPLLSELEKQPAPLQIGLRRRRALTAIQDQGVAHTQVPHRGLHRVFPQALEGTQPFEAVDHHEVIGRI